MMDEKTELTVEDFDVLIDAVEDWITASRNSSMLAGLMIGAMSFHSSSDVEQGANIFRRLVEGEDEKAEGRKEIAALLKVKLIRMRDALMVKSVSDSLGS